MTHGADEPWRQAFVKTIANEADCKMNPIKIEAIEYERKRWMRPDAYLFIRPDWRRYVARGSEAEAFFVRYERKYRPDQARVPPGSREGGRWTDDDEHTYEANPSGGPTPSEEGYSDGLVRVAQADNGIVTDALGEPYYRPGGHHEVPKSVYAKWDLHPETRAVFENSTTGTIRRILVRTSPDGAPQGHYWDQAHRQYNEAVKELGEQYLEKNKITPEQMTPNQARDILKEIRESKDARIRNYNTTLRFIRRIYRLRGGRE